MPLSDEQLRALDPRVRAIVWRHFRGVPDHIAGADDLAQYGLLAAMKASDRWDPAGGASLTTWSLGAAYRGIQDALRVLTPGSRLGPPVHVTSLDAPRGTGERSTLADLLPDDDFDFGDPVRTRALDRALGALTLDEQSVIALRFDEDLSLGEIGEMLGVSESRVSQMLSCGLERLAAHPGLAAAA